MEEDIETLKMLAAIIKSDSFKFEGEDLLDQVYEEARKRAIVPYEVGFLLNFEEEPEKPKTK